MVKSSLSTAWPSRQSQNALSRRRKVADQNTRSTCTIRNAEGRSKTNDSTELKG